MQPWVLSDGTEVRLGGDVRGDSALARSLNGEADYVRNGGVIPVRVRPPPDGSETLDLSTPAHVDSWVRNAARLKDVSVTSAPDVEYPQWENQLSEPGLEY